MEVSRSAMGPERVQPSPEDELGGDGPGDGGDDGGEEEEEDEAGGGYHYQPLNQDPDGPGEPEDEDRGAASRSEQLQQLQQRIEVMRLHLPEAPPPDSEEEEQDPEGAAAQRSRASIPMDPAHVELVKRTMAGVALPSLGVPPWAQQISDAQWSDLVQDALQRRGGPAALPLRRNHVP